MQEVALALYGISKPALMAKRTVARAERGDMG
jgi:hypothetical protein